MGAIKVATCCYCGTRAALVLRGEKRLELSCSTCGAPLSRLKMLPNAAVPASAPVATTPRRTAKSTGLDDRRRKPKNPKKRKYRKGLFRKVFEEIWDEIEDIFD